LRQILCLNVISMGFSVLSAKKYNQKLKVTVQSTGKLGFSDETAKAMDLQSGTFYVKFVVEDETKDMYLVLLDSPDEDAFKVCKAGEYYYLPTTQMFNDLKVDYKSNTVIYDLTRSDGYDNELCGSVYKMDSRVIKKKTKIE